MSTDAIVVLGPDVVPDAAALGGKGAGLARLAACGAPVPPAFVVTAEGFRRAVGADVRRELEASLAALPADLGGEALEEAAEAIRARILEATEGHPLTADVAAAHAELASRAGDDDLAVAVRSSSVAEDAADRSFAGEHDTFLWVRGAEEVDLRLRECWASLVTARAVAYRRDAGGPPAELAMAVVVQQMVPARSAGVLMTLNPVNGDRSKVMVESVWGLGEPLVSGAVTPDRFLVDKVTGEVLRRELAVKATEAVRDPQTGRGVAEAEVEEARRTRPSLTDEELAELVRLGREVERAAGCPQDAEFAVVDEGVHLLQARPETVWASRAKPSLSGGGSAIDAVLRTLTKTSR